MDNGLTWSSLVNLNNHLEGSDEISGISAITLYNGSIVAGATNGNIFVAID